ncbi:hypothetical protein IJT93_13320 [bacterium]|nr:hypothetical protein [bacterium]
MSVKLTSELLQLQDLDNQISLMERQINNLRSLPKESEELLSMRSRYGEAAAKAQNLNAAIAKNSQNEAALTKKVSQLHNKIYGGQIGSSKELQALQLELEDCRNRLSVLQEQILEDMEEAEQLAPLLPKLQIELENAERSSRRDANKIQRDIAKLEGNIKDLREERSRQLQLLDQPKLYAYNNLYVSKNKRAVAEVKDKRCGECMAQLTETKINELYKNKLIFCDVCGRILALRRAAPEQ